ncbi:MAG: hypothetical protein QOE29_875, partial [Gaiellaceae bacterium]|nr:hypothetical protein [Gaiellaceae bacterium]
MRRWRSSSLTVRTTIASVTLGIVVAAVAVGLLSAVFAARAAAHREVRAQDLTSATLDVQGLVVDLETGLRGLAITGDTRFLEPWVKARAALPSHLQSFKRLAATEPRQASRARELAGLITAYIEDYSAPLVSIARDQPAAASTPVATAEGKRRIDAIRSRFTTILGQEQSLADRSAADADRQSRRAVIVAIVGLTALSAIVVLFAIYIARSIARPVRQVAGEAQRLAAGDVIVGLTEMGPGEVGELTRAFNSMARQLEARRRELEAQNEQLRDSEHAKSELVSIVSHELRTPLTSMLGFTSLLSRGELDEEARERYLEIIARQ